MPDPERASRPPSLGRWSSAWAEIIAPSGGVRKPGTPGPSGAQDAMITLVPMETRSNRSSESGMCIRMHPWEA